MKRMLMLVVFALVLVVSAPCYAIESGWWWNPEQSGRGVAIEIQDTTIFVAIYAYDAVTGEPIWYSCGGQMQSATRFVGSLQRFEHGQCLGCGYQPPQGPIDMGQVVVEFVTNSTGQITYNGETIPIERFDFSPCVNSGPPTDFRNLCSGYVFMYASSYEAMAFSVEGDYWVGAVADSSGNMSMYVGMITTNKLFTLLQVSADGDTWYDVYFGSMGELSTDGQNFRICAIVNGYYFFSFFDFHSVEPLNHTTLSLDDRKAAVAEAARMGLQSKQPQIAGPANSLGKILQ